LRSKATQRRRHIATLKPASTRAGAAHGSLGQREAKTSPKKSGPHSPEIGDEPVFPGATSQARSNCIGLTLPNVE
jgi:hypothetical protein